MSVIKLDEFSESAIYVVFIGIGPIIGTHLVFIEMLPMFLVGFLPVGFIVGFVPGLLTALAYHYGVNKRASTTAVPNILLLFVVAAVGALTVYIIWIVALSGLHDAVLLRLCLVAAITAVICACICQSVASCRIKWVSG